MSNRKKNCAKNIEDLSSRKPSKNKYLSFPEILKPVYISQILREMADAIEFGHIVEISNLEWSGEETISAKIRFKDKNKKETFEYILGEDQ